jgi:hypothetical protein
MIIQVRILLLIGFFALLSCDRSGNVFIVSKYPFTIVVHAEFEYLGEQLERTFELESEEVFAIASRHIEYSYITGIYVKNKQGIVLAEYPKEYIRLV